VFFPSARTPERFCGRAAVEERFRQVFEQERRGAASGPPYLELRPEGLEIQVLEGAAIASFVLRNRERVARRTIVFRDDHGTWRIVHLHGSNVPWPDAH
jgi:ketosteroid isomerase-like protein